jgi:hypothetical protein
LVGTERTLLVVSIWRPRLGIVPTDPQPLEPAVTITLLLVSVFGTAHTFLKNIYLPLVGIV